MNISIIAFSSAYIFISLLPSVEPYKIFILLRFIISGIAPRRHLYAQAHLWDTFASRHTFVCFSIDKGVPMLGIPFRLSPLVPRIK